MVLGPVTEQHSAAAPHPQELHAHSCSIWSHIHCLCICPQKANSPQLLSGLNAWGRLLRRNDKFKLNACSRDSQACEAY